MVTGSQGSDLDLELSRPSDVYQTAQNGIRQKRATCYCFAWPPVPSSKPSYVLYLVSEVVVELLRFLYEDEMKTWR